MSVGKGVPAIDQQTANRFAEPRRVDAPCMKYTVSRARASALPRVGEGVQRQ